MTHKILVVDDEPDMGPLITGMFRRQIRKGELEFLHAQNGALALEILDDNSEIDLILTDINMPVMDGLTFLSQIKERGLIQKAIVISAYNDLKNIRTAMNRGAFDFITKPIDVTDIKATIEKGIGEMLTVYNSIETKKELEEATREKERLILEQNKMLEIQVAERTETINNQKILLESKNKEILDSIHYAKNLQNAILPPLGEFHSMISEGFILYQAKDIVSGDFYWFSEIDERKVVVAADCTGHGVAGALMSMMGISLLNQIVNDQGITTPSLILDHMNAAVTASKGRAEENAHVGMDVAICVFNSSMNTMQYAGANRPLWLIRNGEALVTKPDKSPIGGMHGHNLEKFTNHDISIQKEDSLYIFTDGYADQFGGADGKKIMSRNFRDLLISIQATSMDEQRQRLHDHFNDWQKDEEQVDDILVIGVKL